MRKTKLLVTAALAATITMAPLSASAATAPPPAESQAKDAMSDPYVVPGFEPPSAAQRFVWPGMCRHAFMRVRETTLVHTRPSASAPAFRLAVRGGFYHPCRALTLGARYTDCGGTNANGWILIPYMPAAPHQGYIKSTCTDDPEPLPPPSGGG